MIPRLNRLLTLEDPQTAPDMAGGFNRTWVPLGTLWAAASPRTGREVAQNGATLSRMPYRITVRAAPVGSPSRPRPEQRFRDGNRIYTINAVTEDAKSDLYLVCYAEEEVVA